MQTCTHRLINDTNKKNVKECDSLRILRVGSSCLGSGTAPSCCRLQGQLLPSIRLPSCSHLLNRAFNKPSPIIQFRVVSVSSWDYFSGKTSCPHLHPSLSLPPSAFLFQSRRSCRLSYLTPHLLCGWPCPWVVRNRIFLLSEPLESWQLFRVGCPSPTLSAAPPRPAAHTAPSGPPTLSSL